MPIHPHECAEHGMFDVITLKMHAVPDPRCPVCLTPGERRYGVPLLKTNTAYLRDAQYGGGQFDPHTRRRYEAEAKRAGVSINGKVYVYSLAAYPGDPRAWIDDINDAKKIVEERGWGSERLGVKARQPEAEPKPAPVGQDIVDDEVLVRTQGGVYDPADLKDKKKLAKIREEVRDHITPHWSKPGAKSTPLKKRASRKGKK